MSVVWLVALLSSSPESGALLYRSAHSAPFGTYADWRSFMERAPDPSQRPAMLDGYIDRESFDMCFADSPGWELEAHTIRREWITYMSDGLRVRALLVRRAQTDTNAQPLIVFLHGGVARWGKITSLDILEMCHWASQGVAVLAPTYRGEMGSEGRPNLGAGEVADVLHAVKAVEGIESIDSSRAVLWGFSRGGATAYRVLAASERFRAAVILAGPTDRIGDPRREEFHTHVYPGIVDDYESDPDSALGAISAIQWPERLA
ncbi:MAG: alpha/beta fold hydrolase, partial [Myxococcota bacterium]